MNNIRKLRNSKNITMKKLGEIIGVAESTISLYETSKREPDNKTLVKIAEYFDVSVDYLLGRSDVSNAEPYSFNGSKGVKIPVYGSVAAGVPIEAIEDILDYEEIDTEMAKRGEYIALKIKGDSMEPRIYDGDVVIVKLQPDVDNGEIAVVMVNGDEATCKKIMKQEQGINLVSLNPAYSPMFYTNEEINNLPIRILGKVVELRGKF